MFDLLPLANAVIIFDYPRGRSVVPSPTFHMCGTTNNSNKVTIPSVMVSNMAGLQLEAMVVSSGIVPIFIDAKDPYLKICNYNVDVFFGSLEDIYFIFYIYS